MKHKNYLSILTLMVTFILAACSSEDYTDDPIFDQEIKTELVDKSELPQWLADYVTYLEYIPEDQPLPSETAGIYRFEWNDRTFYEISSSTQSSMHQAMYDADGNRIILEEEDYKSLSEGARNWTIVYLFNYTHEKQTYIVYPVNIEDTEVQLFFQNLIADGKMNNGIKFSKTAFSLPTCYVINSPDELRAIYEGNDPLPVIDYDKYTLIIGIAHVPRGAYLKRQELTHGDIYFHSNLRLYYEKPLTVTQELIGRYNSSIYYYALYPKLSSHKLYTHAYINYREAFMNKDISSSSSFADSLCFSTDWESNLKNLVYISEDNFRKIFIGHGWQETSFYRLKEDGSYDENDVWKMGGISIHYYEFNFTENTVTDYWRNSNPSHGKIEDSFMYSSCNNMVYIGHQADFQIISVQDDRVGAIKRIHIPSIKLGEVKDISYVVILQRLSNEELEKVKKQF